MATSRGKTIGLIILVLLILLIAYRMTPFYLAPFGMFSGVFNTIKHLVKDGLHICGGHFFGFPFSFFFSFLFFIIWIMVIVWVYRDAESRNLNGLLWALLVLIGNIIGLIIYLIIRNERTLKTTSENDSIICSSCGKSFDCDYSFCPHCGKNPKNLCSSCNKELQKEWQVCPHCGTKV